MSLFEHLVERALELARPVEPVIDPSRLGPPTLGPSSVAGFEETIVERPAGQPGGRVSTSVVTWTSPTPAPVADPGRVAAPMLGPASVIMPRSDPRPIVAGPRSTSVIAPTSTSGPTLVEREGRSVIVERRVEPRVERTRELIREREPGIEPRSEVAPMLDRPVRSRDAAPIEPRIESRVEGRRGEPNVVVIEAPPSIASPVMPVPVRREAPTIASPVVPARRSEPSAAAPASSTPVTSRLAPPDPGPTLRIEIGRVIVRAESPAPQRRSSAASARPTTSLADYLASRDRGER